MPAPYYVIAENKRHLSPPLTMKAETSHLIENIRGNKNTSTVLGRFGYMQAAPTQDKASAQRVH
jgi:hypothetical protein